MNTQYPNLVMLYATHVLEGMRTIESVPSMIREDVAFVVDHAKKKIEAPAE